MEAVPRTPDSVPKHVRWLLYGILGTVVLFAVLLFAVGYDCGNRPITLRCFDPQAPYLPEQSNYLRK